MYNMWPESVPFRDCADLNFPAYLDKIKEPIALDVIKEMLDEENPQQYSSVRSFLADLRKMFRNCYCALRRHPHCQEVRMRNIFFSRAKV